MTALSRSALETEIASLIADNTSGNITAADVRQVQDDTADSCFNITSDTYANILSGAISCSTISATDNITVANGKAIGTDTTTAHTMLIRAYDVDGTAYKTFATLTNGNTPSFAIAAPAGGTVAIDGAVIGGSTPAAITGTTLTATGVITGGASSDIAINTNKFTVAASSGNTLVAGTLAVTGVVTFTTYTLEGVGNALTAAGTNQGTGLQLAKAINNVTTAGSGTGVILPAAQVGMTITLYNAGINPIKVYGNGSDTIDTVAGATGVTLTNAKRCMYQCVAAATWVSSQLGVISA